MTDIDQKYYKQLFERVQVMIQTPRFDEDGTLLLHIYRSESWGQPSGWTAFLPKGADEGDAIHINRVRWKSKRDIKRMNIVTQPARPTLIHAQTTVDAAAFENLMSVGRKIRVPLFDVPPINAFNGTFYGMVIPPSSDSPIQTQIELQWWEQGAAPWQSFTGWAFKMIELFEGAF